VGAVRLFVDNLDFTIFFVVGVLSSKVFSYVKVALDFNQELFEIMISLVGFGTLHKSSNDGCEDNDEVNESKCQEHSPSQIHYLVLKEDDPGTDICKLNRVDQKGRLQETCASLHVG